MARNVWLLPRETMFVDGMEVIKILCKPTAQMEFIERERLRKLGLSKRRPIVCINNGKVYKSMKDAANELGLNPGAISRVCNTKQLNTKGFVFKFV